MSLAPRNADALSLLGVALIRSDRLVEGIEQFRLAIAVEPDVGAHHMNLGYALLQAGKADEAVTRLETALSLAPGSPETLLYLGLALRGAGRLVDAERALRVAVQAAPRFDAARHELSRLLCVTGEEDEARIVIRESPSPLSQSARLRLALISLPPVPRSLAHIGETRSEFEATLDSLLAEGTVIKDPFAEIDATAFFLSYHGLPNRSLHEKLAHVHVKGHPHLAWTAPHCNASRRRPGKLRIGIISRFLYWHSIGRTTRGLVAMLDRDRFDVTAIFAPPATHDHYSRAIARDAARSIVLRSNLQAARDAIAALELDVLFYQDIGMDAFTYFLAFARLAPVQCVSFGHPDTTGIPSMDWWISSERYEPAGAENQYSERLWRIPAVATLAYYYHPARGLALPTRDQLGLPASARLYTCPQMLFKLHPAFDSVAARILRADGNGLLVLIQPPHKRWLEALIQRFRQSMPDVADRVLVLPRLEQTSFLGLLAASDVVLDTPHFNGMNSSLDSFSVCTPIVTQRGTLQRMRHTAAMYDAMGIEGLCANTDDEYVRCALEIAREPERRMAYTRLIGDRQGVLYEDVGVVRGFETFFEQATEEH